MPQSNQDYTARRFRSFHTCDDGRSGAGYDTELPEQARLELGRLRHPRILERPKKTPLNPAERTKLHLSVFVALSLAAGLIASWVNYKSPEIRVAISLPTPTPQPTVVPSPTPGPARSWQEYIANNPPAPRAALVKLPPPRAELVRVPDWKPGEERQLTMPYGLKVLGRFKGRLDAEWMLPASGSQIGDTWLVGDTSWIWLCAPGATHADWIDP